MDDDQTATLTNTQYFPFNNVLRCCELLPISSSSSLPLRGNKRSTYVPGKSHMGNSLHRLELTRTEWVRVSFLTPREDIALVARPPCPAWPGKQRVGNSYLHPQDRMAASSEAESESWSESCLVWLYNDLRLPPAWPRPRQPLPWLACLGTLVAYSIEQGRARSPGSFPSDRHFKLTTVCVPWKG